MPSLSGNVRLGTGSVSSLIKSASATQNALISFDKYIADTAWSDSAKTEADYKEYSKSINGLLGRSKGDTSLTGQRRTDTLSQSLVSAGAAFNSAQVKRAQINILQGTGTQADKVNLLAQLYTQAADPADQQSILLQYDEAAKTLNDQNQARAQKAASDAQSNLQKGYTRKNTMATTLVSQLAASIKTGTNQIDPKLLSGTNTVFLGKDGTVAFDQAHAQPGSRAVTISIPAAGGKINPVDLYHLYGMVLVGQYNNETHAASDPNLTSDQQATHAQQASSMYSSLQSSIYTNSKLALAEAQGQPALVRQAVNGTAQLKENANVDAAGKYILNPTPQSLQNSLAAQKKSGSTQGVDFNMVVDGIPTTYKMRNLGNAVVANDPFATDAERARTFLFDSRAGKLVPFSDQHQAQFNEARAIGDPAKAQAAEQAVVNQVQSGYGRAQAAKTGQIPADEPLAGVRNAASNAINSADKAIKKGADSLFSTLATDGKKLFGIGTAPEPKAPSPTHDPLGRLGNGMLGSLGTSVFRTGIDIGNYLGNLIGGHKPMNVTAPPIHPNVPLPSSLPRAPAGYQWGTGAPLPSVITDNQSFLHQAPATAVANQANFNVDNPATAPRTGNAARDVGNLVSGLTGGAIPGPGL